MNKDTFEETNNFETFYTPTEVQEFIDFVIFCTEEEVTKGKQ